MTNFSSIVPYPKLIYIHFSGTQCNKIFLIITDEAALRWVTLSNKVLELCKMPPH